MIRPPEVTKLNEFRQIGNADFVIANPERACGSFCFSRVVQLRKPWPGFLPVLKIDVTGGLAVARPAERIHGRSLIPWLRAHEARFQNGPVLLLSFYRWRLGKELGEPQPPAGLRHLHVVSLKAVGSLRGNPRTQSYSRCGPHEARRND